MGEKILYNRIAVVMVEEGIKGRELAEFCGVKEHTVSRWRTNDQQPSLVMLHRIALYAHRDVRDLLVQNKLPTTPVRKK
jgi:transcriptional regulator with XRE-family HTH domain